MTSIVVLTYNQLEDCTKSCIESIYTYTNIKDFELIVVDNDSKDGTPKYLKEIEPKYTNIQIILNDQNKGYSGGNNDGIKASKGEFVIFLNNDTLVSPNWLEQILKPFKEDKKIGMVGPISNSVGNEQRVNIDGLNDKNYNEKISKYLNDNKDVVSTTKRLGFFCVAIKKELIDKIGLLDEKFGIGMFEDDDYCMRAMKENYKLVITDGCFIYHKGSVSFKKLTTDAYHDIFTKNKNYFLEKHGVPWSYSDLLIGYFNYFIQISENNNILYRQEDCKNMILFLKDIELKSDVEATTKLNKQLMEMSDWATGLKNNLDINNEELKKVQSEKSELNKQLMEMSDWATGLKNNLDEQSQELEIIKNNLWYRVLRKLNIIKERPVYLKLLSKTQELIKNNTTNPNLELYQSQELFYWEHIPKWINDNISTNMNILDIGCGYGTLGVYCKLLSPNSNIKVIDLIEYANVNFLKLMNINFEIQNIETDNLNNKYDIIILSEVLEHFNFHPVSTLQKIKNHLNQNGILILTTPDAKSWGKIDKYYKSLNSIPNVNSLENRIEYKWIDDHIWQYEKKELFEVIKKSGFYIDKEKNSQGIDGKQHFNLLLKTTP